MKDEEVKNGFIYKENFLFSFFDYSVCRKYILFVGENITAGV